MVRVLVAAASLLLSAAGVGASPTAKGLAGRCTTKEVPGTIGGKRVCLHSGQRCKRSLDTRYHRYDFHCHRGVLRPSVWRRLARPVRIPMLAPGAECPVSPATTVSPDFGLAQGPGPVYAVGASPTFHFIYPPVPSQLWYGSRWSGNKILWIARPEYRGPVLIRGRQLDAPREVRFEGALHPAREMRLWPLGGRSASGWQHRPSYTRLRAAGCYAWQVDGTSFSEVIVFRAEIV